MALTLRVSTWKATAMGAIMMVSMFRAKQHAVRYSHSRSSRIATYIFDGNEERVSQRALSDANHLTPKLCMPTPNLPAKGFSIRKEIRKG